MCCLSTKEPRSTLRLSIMAYHRPTFSPGITRNYYPHSTFQSHPLRHGPKTTRRAYSFARCLPRDVVVRICGIYVKELYVESNICREDVIEDGILLLQSVINMSQVCRHWRSFIINDPSLWCHFVNPHHRNRTWTRLLIERSKPLPITYATISPDFIINKDVLAREVALAGRLSSYSVAFNLNCKVWYDNHIPDNWPHLRSLCVAHFTFDDADFKNVDSDMESEGSSDDSDYGEGYRGKRILGYEHDPRFIRHNTNSLLMPKDFPSRRATPRSERLHLHTCTLRSITQITGLTTLTELHVSNNRFWNVLEWVTVLSRLPRLRNVALDRVISNRRFDKEMGRRKLHKAVFSCVSSIIRHLIGTNRLFLNCALQIGHGSIELLGYPRGQNLESLPGDSIGTSGPSTFSGAVIEVDFFCGNRKTPDVLSKWMELFRPLFGNIDSLLFREDDNNSGMIQDDTWLSGLLWASSHRLSEIIGINQRGWKTICQNMFSKAKNHISQTAIHRQRSNNEFLKALKQLELWASPSPVGTQFKNSVLAFCTEKQAMGAPLECIRPMIIPADGLRGQRDCEDLIEQLRRHRIPVDPNYYSDSDSDN